MAQPIPTGATGRYEAQRPQLRGDVNHTVMMELSMRTATQLRGITPAQFNPLLEFDRLPASALVDVRTISRLACRSVSSIYRDIAAGRLARPTLIGPNAARWRVADVRAYLEGGEV